MDNVWAGDAELPSSRIPSDARIGAAPTEIDGQLIIAGKPSRAIVGRPSRALGTATARLLVRNPVHCRVQDDTIHDH
ncbi:hypothetical protein AB0F15_03675 [Amycolatopsis sp. NPDC026612]|uniref:hypothetical protein n=1 Tax=Amycolatopsis sp. NPDC026612 TaxID=3155466 RepID=UPI0033D97D80